jgi:hypothetical protein
MLSAEHLFARRLGKANGTYSGTAGEIYKQIIDRANAVQNLRIVEGDIWTDGPELIIPSRDDTLYDLLSQLQEDTGNDWWLTPDIDANGRLYFRANWRKRVVHRTHHALIEGRNIESPSGAVMMVEDELVNDLAMVGEGANTTAKPRFVARHDESIKEYGVWQGAEAVTAKNMSQLRARAHDALEALAWPQRRFWLTALDIPLRDDEPTGPTTFRIIDLGDVDDLYLHSVGGEAGVQTTVRIAAREFSSRTGKCILVAEEEVEQHAI